MKFSKKFWTGIILVMINYPVGWGAMLTCNALALMKNDPAYSFWGMGVYVLSWGMFGLGLLLAGPQGIQYSRIVVKKVWHFMLQSNKE